MRKTQRGVTLLGWIFLLVPLAIMVYAAIRLTPIYLNYMAVSKVMDQVAKESDGGQNAALVRVAIEKHLDIEGINVPTAKDIKIQREGEDWVAIADYEELAPLAGNVSLLVQFHKQVKL
jgi:hypothetical protein